MPRFAGVPPRFVAPAPGHSGAAPNSVYTQALKALVPQLLADQAADGIDAFFAAWTRPQIKDAIAYVQPETTLLAGPTMSRDAR